MDGFQAQTVEDDEDNIYGTARSPDKPMEAEEVEDDFNYMPNIEVAGAEDKVKLSTAAKIYFNSAETIKRWLLQVDIALKGQLLWFELSSTLYWVSLIELLVTQNLFWIYITHPDDLGNLWIHIVHLPRAMLGLYIVYKLPNTHDLIQTQGANLPETVTLPDMIPTMASQVKTKMSAFLNQTSKYLRGYLVLSVICNILDLLSFWVGVAHFNTGDDHKAYFATVLLIMAVFYLFTDCFYGIWAVSLYMKLPKDLASAAFKAVTGVADKLAPAIDRVLGKKAS
jgi:hypothetical protein